MFIVAECDPSLSSVRRIRAEMTLNRPCCEVKMLLLCSFSLVVKWSHKFGPVSLQNGQAIPDSTRISFSHISVTIVWASQYRVWHLEVRITAAEGLEDVRVCALSYINALRLAVWSKGTQFGRRFRLLFGTLTFGKQIKSFIWSKTTLLAHWEVIERTIICVTMRHISTATSMSKQWFANSKR